MNRWSSICIAVWGLTASTTEAASVVGRIVDGQGRPPDAVAIEVVALCSGGAACWESREEKSNKLSATTATDGSFRIRLPSDWPPSEIRISSPGSRRLCPADIVTGGHDLDLGLLMLPSAQTLSGFVRNESGDPVAGARVTAIGLDGRSDLLPGEAYTDGSGRYVIGDAPLHLAQTSIIHGDYVSQSVPRTRDTWILKAGGAVRGVIVDAQNRPVANVRLAAAGRSVVTTALGEFTLRGLPPGLTHVSASDGEERIATADLVIRNHEIVQATLRLVSGGSVRGAIRDAASGRPLPWTRVRVSQGSTTSPGGHDGVTAIADASGVFRLTALEPGEYTFEVQRLGYLRSVQSRSVARASRPTDLELSLSSEARIEGTIVDATDRPIAGARVSVAESNPMQELPRQLRAGMREPVFTVSDRKGQFVLRGLWPGRALRVDASASGFVPARLEGIDLGSGELRSGVKISLHPGAVATGIVTDQLHRPLSDVYVYSTRMDESGAAPGAAAMLQTRAPVAAITDNQGRFVESGLEQGRYMHTFTRTGYSRGFIPSTRIVAGLVNELPPITLPVAAAIRGHVVDQQRRPVSGASIYAIDRNLEIVAASSDDNGAFELTNLSEGDDVSLQVDSEPSSPAHIRVHVPASDVLVQLTDAYTVRGRVYDAATTQPVTDFTVERIVRAPGTTAIRLGATAGRPFHADDGSFELSRVQSGPCVLRIRSPGYLAAEITVPAVPWPDIVSVPMVHGISVIGRVLLAGTRQPVPNATITWHQGGAQRLELEAMFSPFASAEDTTVTDGEGRFVLESVPPGAVTLTATHPEYAPTRVNLAVPGREGLEVILNPGGSVSGVVVLDDGGPAAGATVAVTPAGAHASMLPADTLTTDASGRFRIGHLRKGSYVLIARSPTGASRPYTVTIAGSEEHDDVVISLKSGTTIRGVVHGLSATAQSGVFVMAHGDGYYDSTFTDNSGAFTLPHVPAGAVAVEATTSFSQGISAVTRIEIPEDGPSVIEADVDFSGHSTLLGVVTRLGRAAGSVLLSAAALDPATQTRGRAESAGDGRYRIDGLSDGPYQLVASGPFGAYRRIVDVQGWTECDLDLPAGSITGTVTDITSHEPIAEAVVTATTGKERSVAEARRAVTDANGSYALTDLDPGTYHVRATRTGYRQELQTVDVQQTEQRRDLALQRHSNLTLRVFDGANRAPLSQASVRATTRGMLAFAETLSLDNAGRAEMPDLVPGDYLLTVAAGGYAPRSLPIRMPSTALEVPLETGGRVQLRLAGATSTRVRLVDTAGLAQAVPGSDPAGWTPLAGPATLWPNVSSGSYRLESMTGGITPLVVRAGGTSVVDVK